MQSESLPVERQTLGSNPSLIRGGTTSYSFHSIRTITVQGTLKGSKGEKNKKKNLQTEGTSYERFQLNFEFNKEDRRIFLDVVLSLWFACLRKHKLKKIKSSTLLVVVQNTKPKEEQPLVDEYQNLLLYLKSTITIPMSHAAKLVSMSALTIQKLPVQLLSPKYSLLAVTK